MLFRQVGDDVGPILSAGHREEHLCSRYQPLRIGQPTIESFAIPDNMGVPQSWRVRIAGHDPGHTPDNAPMPRPHIVLIEGVTSHARLVDRLTVSRIAGWVVGRGDGINRSRRKDNHGSGNRERRCTGTAVARTWYECFHDRTPD